MSAKTSSPFFSQYHWRLPFECFVSFGCGAIAVFRDRPARPTRGRLRDRAEARPV